MEKSFGEEKMMRKMSLHLIIDLIYSFSLFHVGAVAHLKAVKSAVVLQGEHVVRDGEDVSLSSDQAPDVQGLR